VDCGGKDGSVLSIRVTRAVSLPVFPTVSSNSNVNVQLEEKLNANAPELLITEIGSEQSVKLAITS
jgi:hypothetical protein